MGLGKFFESVFGGARAASKPVEESSETLEYKGFTI